MCIRDSLSRDQVRIVRHNATRVHHAKLAAEPLTLAINAVAGDARLVAHDRAATLGEPVEKRGLAHVGPAHDGYQWEGRGAGLSGRCRSTILRQDKLQSRSLT